MSNLKVLGVSSYAPEGVISNHDLTKIVDTSDEWIKTRTGISNRRIVKAEDGCELAFRASEEALKKANLTADDIDLIIVSSTAPDYHIPTVACKVQGMLGAKNAVAFDINAACSGYVYALKIAKQFAFDCKYKNILIICSEVLSKIVDWNDRNTCVLFGDGACATILQNNSEKENVISVEIFSDGSQWEALTCKSRSINNPLREHVKENNYIDMDGKSIFKFATRIITEGIKDLLDKNNISIDDIKYIVPHQANTRMFEYCAKKLNIDLSKFYINIQEYGNTSSASMGIALNEIIDKGLLNRGDKIILVGFGGGLTWGYALVEY